MSLSLSWVSSELCPEDSVSFSDDVSRPETSSLRKLLISSTLLASDGGVCLGAVFGNGLLKGCLGGSFGGVFLEVPFFKSMISLDNFLITLCRLSRSNKS